MQGFKLLLSLALSAFVSGVFSQETHTITFDTSKCSGGSVKFYNNTNYGYDGQEITVSGNKWTGSGPLIGARIYHDNGHCQSNPPGGECTILELHLQNEPSNPAPNSVDISLIDGFYKFTDGIAFTYTNGPRAGYGASCGDPNCLTAFHEPPDTCAQIDTGGENLNLAVSFCVTESKFTAPGYPTCTTLSGPAAT